MRALLGLLAGAVISLTLLSLEPVVAQQAPAALPAESGADTLSVMTYNVEGLPVPLAWGRSRAAGRIAERLAALREVGRQPHVVVLQEAFGSAQRAIGREAGYRYVAFGPDAGLASDEPEDAADRAFAKDASFWVGERAGKWADSGLAVLSDYPIVAVRRAAFPAHACAGTDCLANKGVLLAMVQVPGADRPVAVIATHMNAKNTCGRGKARWNGAYARQVQSIGRFLLANLPADTPYVLAGDLNIGKSAERRGWMEAMLASLPRGGRVEPVRSALGTCLAADGACALAEADDVRFSARRNKDWQFYADGAGSGLTPTAIAAPFGHDARGRMLSDHVGYTAFYRVAARAAADAPVRMAALR